MLHPVVNQVVALFTGYFVTQIQLSQSSLSSPNRVFPIIVGRSSSRPHVMLNASKVLAVGMVK